MDSAWDQTLSRSPDPVGRLAAPRGTPGLLRRLVSRRAGPSAPDATIAARARQMGLSTGRVAALVALAAALAVSAAWFWTVRTHEAAARDTAAVALEFVERRLGAVELELAMLSRSAEWPATLEACPPPLVARLLEQSLESSLVRRFDVVQVGAALRCEPGGARTGRPLDELPPGGLSIAAGSHAGARPMVRRPLGGAMVLQATLEPTALALAQSALPLTLQALPVRIDVRSPQAGGLRIRDSRPRPGQTGPALLATANSTHYNVGVQVQIDQADLAAAVNRNMVWSVTAALCLVAAGIVVVWQRALRRVRLTHRLERGLRKRQFVPYVQPIVDLASGHCVGGEVLMRWQHPHRGVLGPSEFIGEAERSGLIVGMSDLTMTQAARRLAALAQQRPGVYFSFNVTPLQLRQPDFARRLAETFGPDTIPADQVLLEVTEREFVDAETRGALARLIGSGWRFAIDDFGTGHSSLAALEKLTIQRIKIDRAFVRTIDEGTVNRPVLDAIIGLAEQLGVPLIAEGVETPSQRDYLLARGVRHAQGFLMARPMPLDAFEAWLGEHVEQTPAAHPPGHASPAADLKAHAQALWHALQQPGGVTVSDRRFRLRVYRQCFVGREAVDWIVARTGTSRADALRIGRLLVSQDRIRHVVSEHDFEDADYFYRFVEPVAEARDSPPVEDLRQALRSIGGPSQRGHARGLLRFRGCATGQDIVDALSARYAVQRGVASQWAAQMMRSGALRHVFDDRPFHDDRTLYRIT